MIGERETAPTYRLQYDPFDYHQTSPACRALLVATRQAFKTLRAFINTVAPNCRERSLALTKLQEALSATIQAVVFTHPDSVPVED